MSQRDGILREKVKLYIQFWHHHSESNWRRVSNYVTIVSIGLAVIFGVYTVSMNANNRGNQILLINCIGNKFYLF